MRDRNLERNIERVEEFVELWKQLSAFLDRGFNGDEFAAEEESDFLELKSQIAQQHQMLVTLLGSQIEYEEKVPRLMNGMPSLASFKELDDGMGKRLANEWHTTFISSQSLLGRLKGQKARLSGVSTFQTAIKNVLGHPIILVLVAVAAAYGVFKFTEEWVPKLIQMMETTE